MRTFGEGLIAVLFIAAAMALSNATAEQLNQAQGGGNSSTRSLEFWTESRVISNSDDFIALKKAVGSADRVNAAVAEGKKIRHQSIANMAIDRPAEVANLMTSIAGSSSGTANQSAIATVLMMRTTAKAREAAAPLVAPAVKTQLAAITANLSTGIAGLPGIYLGDNAQANGARAGIPTGYSLVAGSSIGCRMR